MAIRSKPARKSSSRTQKRYLDKREVQNRTPHPISPVGGGQGGMMTPSGSAGSGWG
jgi:hypothetical protein